jgi:hypothetical protein
MVLSFLGSKPTKVYCSGTERFPPRPQEKMLLAFFRGVEHDAFALCERESKSRAMFCEHAKPRAGVARFLSDGEEILVTDSHLSLKKYTLFKKNDAPIVLV